jgi:hypothetical protein
MSQSTTRLVLTRAREMIESPERWLQGAWKRPLPDGTMARCAYQAVHDAAVELGMPRAAAFRALMRALGDGRRSALRGLPVFNDRSRHADVLALFDLALESA